MKKVILFVLMLLPFFAFAKEKVTFSKCVDGDTIKVILDNQEKTVRLLAVDTPESVHPKKEREYYGKEASDFTCNLITNAKKIELEYDTNSDREDKYGRLLAWVFIDDYLLQDTLVRNGYAEVAYLYGDYKYTDILKEHEVLARVERLGIWNPKDDNNYAYIILVIIFVILGLLYPKSKNKLKKIFKKCKIKLN